MLIENAAAMTRGMSEGISEEDQAQQVYQMVRSLDRLLLDEPFEDQPQLYANLAGAQLLVAEPLRTWLARALVTLDGGKFAARLLGDHLSAEQLAQVMQGLVSRQDLAGQVAAFLHALTTDQHKAKAVLAILDARLRSKEQQNPAWLSDAVWSQLRPATVHRDPESLPPFKAEGVAIPADEAAAARAFRESLSVDEADTTREVIKTLVDVLRHEQGDKELIDASDALIGHLPWLVDHQEFALLTRVLESVKEISSEGGTRGKVASGALKKLTEGRLLDTLLAALWASRDTLAEREVRAALKAVADELVEPLVRVLGSEPRGGMRAMISDLLIEMGADRVAELGRFVTDERWYLVRNTANILGRLRNPQATAYLGRLVNHPDYRVRRETVNALASVGTGEAQAMVAAFLDDPDARIRLRALESLDTGEAWKALPKLLALLERRDPWNRSFELKRATLEALARLGARQSLPVIRKLARARLVFGQRGRELRRLSAVTTDIIEGLAVLDGTTR
jgi:HEAT repeat protein